MKRGRINGLTEKLEGFVPKMWKLSLIIWSLLLFVLKENWNSFIMRLIHLTLWNTKIHGQMRIGTLIS